MRVKVADIQRITANEFNVPLATMTEKHVRGIGKDGRNRFQFSRPRQVAMYVACELTFNSKSKIGKLFGDRDHATVIHAHQVVRERIKNDKVLSHRIERIKKLAKAGDNPPPLACVPPPVESLPCPMDKPTIDWRERQNEERRVSPGYTEIMRREPVGPKVCDEDRVHRDPCIKCGTRGDIGCVHTRVAA